MSSAKKEVVKEDPSAVTQVFKYKDSNTGEQVVITDNELFAGLA